MQSDREVPRWFGHSKANGTNPRALGLNPRALGTNPTAKGTNPKATGCSAKQLGITPKQLGISPLQLGITAASKKADPERISALCRTLKSEIAQVLQMLRDSDLLQ